MKKCSSCKRELSEELFFRKRTTSDGLQYECKQCQTSRNALRQILNPEEHNRHTRNSAAKRTERRGISRGKELWLTKKKIRQRYNRSAYKIRKNKTSVGICSACKTGNIKLEYHHIDIASSDTTIPLCRPCHLRAHNRIQRVQSHEN